MREAFTKGEIHDFLAKYGYTTNPAGLAGSFPFDHVSEIGGMGFVDISADAVRKGDEVPDRPVRITFHKFFVGTLALWKLKSVVELAPGVYSKCLDRHQDTPKVSPWPNKKAKKSK
jgi:hypothetical protein